MHVLDHRLQFNGMVHSAIDLACAQAALGHEVAICSGDGQFAEILRLNNVRIIELPRHISGKAGLQSFWSIFKAMRAYRPDVVHAHMVLAALLAWPGTRLLRITLVTSVQNSFSKFSPAMRIGDRVITGCKAVADDMAKRGIPLRLLRPILNGTIGSARQTSVAPAVEAEVRSKAAAMIRQPAVITACGMHFRKGIPDLIDGFAMALASRPDLNLYIFGGGPQEAEYQARAAEKAPGSIHFCGQAAVLKPYLEAGDVFVLASLADPAPLVICEAREAGLAVIGTKVDGIPELLEYGQAGILIDPNAPDQIAAQLLHLFENPDALAEWRGKSQTNVEKLSLRRVALATVDVYRECEAGHRTLATRHVDERA